MRKKEIIHKLGERRKMFEDYLELVRRQPRLQGEKPLKLLRSFVRLKSHPHC